MATSHNGERRVFIRFLSAASSLTQKELGRTCREITTELRPVATNKDLRALSLSFLLSEVPRDPGLAFPQTQKDQRDFVRWLQGGCEKAGFSLLCRSVCIRLLLGEKAARGRRCWLDRV